MKRLLVLCVAITLLGVTGVAGAITITFDEGESTSSVYATTDNFNNGSSIWTRSGNYAFVSGTQSTYAAPYSSSGFDTTTYLTVPRDLSAIPVSATFTFNQTYNYFGMWWGSVDTYNKIDFYLSGSSIPVLELTGGDILTLTGGTSGVRDSILSNGFLNVSDIAFDSITFTSTQYAMEMDNFTVNPVPEPSSMLLLGSGLLALVGFGRKLKR